MVWPKKATPLNPYGANGCQLRGSTYIVPTAMTTSTTATLMATIAALNEALSRIPFTRIAVTIAVITLAGKSINLPVELQVPVAASKSNVALVTANGIVMPKIPMTSYKYCD